MNTTEQGPAQQAPTVEQATNSFDQHEQRNRPAQPPRGALYAHARNTPSHSTLHSRPNSRPHTPPQESPVKTLALAADTIRWLCHMAAGYGALWVAGTTWPTPVAVAAICSLAGADYLLTRPLRWMSDWLTSNTHV